MQVHIIIEPLHQHLVSTTVVPATDVQGLMKISKKMDVKGERFSLVDCFSVDLHRPCIRISEELFKILQLLDDVAHEITFDIFE